MRKNYVLFGLLFVAVTIIYSCSKDIDLSGIEQKNIQSAREIFRTEYLNAVDAMVTDTLPAGEYNPADYEKSLYEGYKLQPGEFTPRWDGASDYESEVSVSILPTFDYLAIMFKNKEEISSMAKIPVFPKLIIDLKSSSCHIAYIIPTPEFYAVNSDVHNHFKTNDMDFCGIVMNYDLKGNLLNVEKYVDGKLTDKANKQSFTGTDDEYYDRVYKMSACHYNMGRAVCISTKGSGEGNPGSNYNIPLSTSQLNSMMSSLGKEWINLSGIFDGKPGTAFCNNFIIRINGIPVSVAGVSVSVTSYTISKYGCGCFGISGTQNYATTDGNGRRWVTLNYGPSSSHSSEIPTMQMRILEADFKNFEGFFTGRP